MKPAVGRVVLYWPEKHECDHEHDQPFQATVVHVHPQVDNSPQLINIGGFTDRGEPYSRLFVQLNDDSEPAPGQCSWMPYQKAQEAKEEDKVTASPFKLTGLTSTDIAEAQAGITAKPAVTKS